MMEKEKKVENRIKIYCVFSKNKELSGGLSNLKDIAKLGGTNCYYESSTLPELCTVFEKINEAIETNYRLKLKNSH